MYTDIYACATTSKVDRNCQRAYENNHTASQKTWQRKPTINVHQPPKGSRVRAGVLHNFISNKLHPLVPHAGQVDDGTVGMVLHTTEVGTFLSISWHA